MKKQKSLPAGFTLSLAGRFLVNFETLPPVKTIDVNALEWWDRSAGNSYFSATVTVNFGMPDQCQILIPSQYGYGEHYKYVARDALKACQMPLLGENEPLWYLKERGIILRTNKVEGCKKRDLLNI